MDARSSRRRRLPANRSSAGLARAELRGLLEEAGREDWLDRAELALSEIVTNALVHAGSEVDLDLSVDDERLRVEVADGSPHLPAARDYSPLAGTGRGLHIVDQLVDAWDVQPLPGDGKVVWFELRSDTTGSGGEVARAEAVDPPDRPRRAGALRVALSNFPLLLHAAWQEHAAALLRERLLFATDPDHDAGALLEHAHASDAMNLLFEQAPAPPLRERPDEIMTSAIEPRVSAADFVVEVPPASLAHFETLDAVLTDTVAVAESGRLLVAPTQPEVREFREWVCRQVREQAGLGGAAEAWSSAPRLHTRDPDVGLAWDVSAVESSPRALLAADDAGHILATSPSALALLGYDDGERLRGRRLLQIVPERYHQAHISGLTLHMTNGRSPLLGRTVTVPVVRADGSETDVDLLIDTHPLSSGRRVFVAEFSEPGSTVRR